jgi:catechol 2,3-dioxygenase-like lactoylglutathione lyase family enzyme
MKQYLSAISLVVPDYDAAIAFYVGKLDFALIEDTCLDENKRWVRIAPTKNSETCLLLAKASNEAETNAIGNQSGGRVFLFLQTDDFQSKYKAMYAQNIEFLEQPRYESYGTVAVFKDPFGNKWDLIEVK